jgi:hypothetical protein
MTTFEAAGPTGPNPNSSMAGAEESGAEESQEAIAGTPNPHESEPTRPWPNKHGRQWRLWRICLTRLHSPSCCG